MEKSRKEVQRDITQKFLAAMESINTYHINLDFRISMRHYTIGSPSGIMVFDNYFDSFLICLYEYTDIKEIVYDLTKKSYRELKGKYLETI